MWAQALKLLSGRRISILGTVRLHYVDALLKPLIKEKVAEMSSATPRELATYQVLPVSSGPSEVEEGPSGCAEEGL